MRSEWVSEGELARLEAEREARQATKYRPARCRWCRKLFTPPYRAPYARYCCKLHRQNASRKKLTALKSEIRQESRRQQAPKECQECGLALPPPGRTAPLRTTCDNCRVRRCRARKRGGQQP